MDVRIKEEFTVLWKKHFGGAELPITLYYTDKVAGAEPAERGAGHRCVICELAKVRKGKSLYFEADLVGCGGGKRYLGFTAAPMPNFEYFLSYGIPGKLEGERYKKSPELVREAFRKVPQFMAPARFIVFKRWDALGPRDEPEVVIFLAQPDVLSGLFTLANFDEVELGTVSSPFGAGCGSIVQYPYLERESERPRAVLGMFDVSARPYVLPNVLSFSVPMNKFERMIGNMEESFLTTPSWRKVKERMGD